MTKQETAKLVAIAMSCFPSMMERDMKLVAAGWHDMLGDLEYELALAALKKVLATAKFFPTVAEIREAAASLMPSDMPIAELAWGEVVKTVQKVGYMKTPEWSHPVIGKVVDAMYGSWKVCCETMQVETVGVDRKHFLDMYATITKRHREDALLPPSVKAIALELAEKLRLPEKAGPVRTEVDPSV